MGDEKVRDRRIAIPLIVAIVVLLLLAVALTVAWQFRVIELRVLGHALLFGRVSPGKRDYYEALPTPYVVWGYQMNSTGVEVGDPYLLAWW